MLDLSAIKFSVNTEELASAIGMVDRLSASVQGMQDAARRAAQNASNAATQTTAATTEVANAQEEAAEGIDRATRVITKQTLAMQILRGETLDLNGQIVNLGSGFTKSQSNMLANLHLFEGNAGQMQQLAESFEEYNRITGQNTFDKSASGINKMTKELHELQQVQQLAMQGLGLTRAEIINFVRDSERLTQQFHSEGRSSQELDYALEELRVRYMQLSGATLHYKAISQQMEDQVKKQANEAIKAARDQEKANDFVTNAMQKMQFQTESFNDSISKGSVNAIYRFEQALKASGKPIGEQIRLLAAYREGMEQVQKTSNSRNTDYISRAIGPQITDIFVSLATGQAPLTVLLQQGGQLRDQFALAGVAAKDMGDTMRRAASEMGSSIVATGKAVGQLFTGAIADIGGALSNKLIKLGGDFSSVTAKMLFGEKAAKALGDSMIDAETGVNRLEFALQKIFRIPLVVGFLLLITTVIALSTAFVKLVKAENESIRVMQMHGAMLGLNGDAALSLAQSYTALGVSGSNAREALTAMAKAGSFTASEIKNVVIAADALEKAGVQSVEETVKAFDKLSKKPTEGLRELAIQMGNIPPKILETVQALELEGRKLEAVTLARDAYARAAKDAADSIKSQYGELTTLADEISGAFGKMWDTIFGLQVKGSYQDQLKGLYASLDELESRKPGMIGSLLFGGDYQRQREEVLKDIFNIENILKENESKAKAADKQKYLQRTDNVYEEAIKSQNKELRKKMSLEEATLSILKERVDVQDQLRMKLEDPQRYKTIYDAARKAAEDEKKKANKEEKVFKSPVDSDLETLKKMHSMRLGVIRKELQTELSIRKQHNQLGLINDRDFYNEETDIATEGLRNQQRELSYYYFEATKEIDAQRDALNKVFGSSAKGEKNTQKLREETEKLTNKQKVLNEYFETTQDVIQIGSYEFFSKSIEKAGEKVKYFLDALKKLRKEEENLADARKSETDISLAVIGKDPKQIAYLRAYAQEQARVNGQLREFTEQEALAQESVARESKRLVQAKQNLEDPKQIANLERSLSGYQMALARIKSERESFTAGAQISPILEGDRNVLLEQARQYEDFVGKITSIDIGSTMAQGFDGASKSVGFLVQSLNQLVDVQSNYNAVRAERIRNGEDPAKIEAEFTRAQITNYAELSGAAKSYFDEKTSAYKILQGVETAFRAMELAGAIKAFAVKAGLIEAETAIKIGSDTTKAASESGFTLITMAQSGIRTATLAVEAAVSSMAGLPFPLNMVALGATVAAIAALGVAISGGGKKGSFAPTNKGTGTVLGAPDQESASVKKSIEALTDVDTLTMKYSGKMLAALKAIDGNTAGLAKLLVQSGAIGVSAIGVQTGFKQDALGKLLEQINNGFGMDKILDKIPVVGEMLGGLTRAVGKFIGGLFGSKTSIKGQGISAGAQNLGSILSGGFQAQYYTDIETKKKTLGITTSKKTGTQYSEADAEFERQVSLVFKSFADSLEAASNPLGTSLDTIQDRLNGFVLNLGRIDIQGLSGQQIQERLTAVFSAAGDNIAKAVLPGLELFQNIGEGYFETVMRVASGVEQADSLLDKLGIPLKNYNSLLNKQGDIAAELVRESILSSESLSGIIDIIELVEGSASDIAQTYSGLKDLENILQSMGISSNAVTLDLIRGAGGFDALQDAISNYQDNFMTDSEKLAAQTASMTKKFQALGLVLPENAQEYVALVKGIDTSTEAGQKLLGRVLGLSEGFSEMNSSVEEAAESMKKFTDQIIRYIDSLNASTGDLGRNFEDTRTAYLRELTKAAGGDESARDSITDYANTYLEAAKAQSVTALEYERIVGFVKNQLMQLTTGETELSGPSLLQQGSNIQAAPDTQTKTAIQVLDKILTKLSDMQDEDRAENQAIVTNLSSISKVIKRIDNGDSIKVTTV